jgi:hypothetical protein
MAASRSLTGIGRARKAKPADAKGQQRYSIVAGVPSKNDAAPKPWVPAESSPANDRCRRYDNRCRGNHSGARYDHDRASIRAARPVWAAMETGAAATLSAGATDGGE